MSVLKIAVLASICLTSFFAPHQVLSMPIQLLQSEMNALKITTKPTTAKVTIAPTTAKLVVADPPTLGTNGQISVTTVTNNIKKITLSAKFNRATTYTVLAYSTITATSAVKTSIDGSVGLFPGTSLVGSPTILGVTSIANGPANYAKLDADTYRVSLLGLPSTQPIITQTNFGGLTLFPGVYRCSSSSMLLSEKALVLDAKGNANAVFVIIIGSSLTIGNSVSGGVVTLINKANYCNVFFVTGTFGNMYPHSSFQGSLLVGSSSALSTLSTINGRIWASTEAVTFDQNTVRAATCEK